MKFMKSVCMMVFCAVSAYVAIGQDNIRTAPEKCGTMENLELQLQRNPQLKLRFEAERARFNQALRDKNSRTSTNPFTQNSNRTVATVPVIVHIVLANPAMVTDAQVQAQLDTLNKDYSGTNGDAVKVPAYFRSVFGQSGIQFCLARQTPNGDPSSGIERITTSKASFLNTDNGVKHAATGGADVWDPSSYLNVWICNLQNGILGYATFPATGDDNEQGVVIDQGSLPGSSLPAYNGGKTLTHETGHYFNLYHIWGDDNGACTGTDFIDDTPNQANSSSTCFNGIKTDNCTPTGNGIMYQNYMDYTDDACLVMFTVLQVSRMETALETYRPSLKTSIGCQVPVSYSLDAQLRSINQPLLRICSSPFSPVVTIRNRGTQTLTSLNIVTVLDNSIIFPYTWTGSLVQLASANVTLSAIAAPVGVHTLKIYLSKPNNGTDQNTVNDTLTINFQYNNPVTVVTEGFEGNVFPPPAWDIVNPDNGITWTKVTGVAKTGNASVMINNHDYSAVGQQDYLRLPNLTVAQTDSVFLTFQLAAATYTSTSTTNNTWDTLEVVVSADCGVTYTSAYKKYASTLVTRVVNDTAPFIPTAAEWRKDSVNLSNFIGAGQILVAFKNTTGYENNIYLDDVNLRTVTVNPNLKSRGFLVTPSPTTGIVTVQFYPQPTNIRGIQIFNMSGQKVAETITNGQSNYYTLDITRYSAGAYIVRVVMGNNVITKKIIKY